MRVTQKRDVKVVQNRKFRKIAEFKCREICAPENREINASRKSHVIRYLVCFMVFISWGVLYCEVYIEECVHSELMYM